MSNVVIEVEDLAKQYRLGQVGRRTLSHDVNRWWHKVRGKEDPYLKIGQENDRTAKGESEYVWALQDINFQVKEGEVLGIIGRNGAGKSTLLKILSKVTAPTKGQVKIKGRIAALLEVGTGFHQDLTGRENIFLNGAILGMTKKEIASKLDEIVDFAGVERYIDTPVKRYSSGMYVRLAFAVAAHLEPEILIIDEVLAVGDAEFQKKCLGKMKDVSEKDGRTVLFVSHNMKAVSTLCDSGIFLTNGHIHFQGNIAEAIKRYAFDKVHASVGMVKIDKGYILFTEVKNSNKLHNIRVNENLVIELSFAINQLAIDALFVDIGIYNDKGEMVVHSKTRDIHPPLQVSANTLCNVTFEIIQPNLAPGSYTFELYVYHEENFNKVVLLWIEDIPLCHVSSYNPYNHLYNQDYLDEIKSVIYPQTLLRFDNGQ